jgi:hypothetical protein
VFQACREWVAPESAEWVRMATSAGSLVFQERSWVEVVLEWRMESAQMESAEEVG